MIKMCKKKLIYTYIIMVGINELENEQNIINYKNIEIYKYDK